MDLFSCQLCGQLVYFENVRCERCAAALGYQLETNRMLSLSSLGDGTWRSDDGIGVRYCANASHAACNWVVVPGDDPAALCVACRLNRTIPDLSVPENVENWRRLELAKRRLVYTLIRLGLPIESGHDQPGGLLFDFVTGHTANGEEGPPITGHANGVITIDLSEADPATRIDRRQRLGERFRTLLGHFRHEAGHYYWSHLVNGTRALDAFRQRFGDETRDYGEALKAYYEQGPTADWNQSFVTAYASSHPHEDWAETFAHYLHIVDTLDSAHAFGVRAKPNIAADDELALDADVQVYVERHFERLWGAWLPLTFAVNELNRSMGNDDLYPFVLPPIAVEKLRFMHTAIRGT